MNLLFQVTNLLFQDVNLLFQDANLLFQVMILLFQVDLPEKTKLKSNLFGPIALPYRVYHIVSFYNFLGDETNSQNVVDSELNFRWI